MAAEEEISSPSLPIGTIPQPFGVIAETSEELADSLPPLKQLELGLAELRNGETNENNELCVRIGAAADKGNKLHMEDAYAFVKNVPEWIEGFQPDAFCPSEWPSPCIFSGVFDGHGGTFTVDHVTEHIFVNFVKSGNWYHCPEECLAKAFETTDLQLGKRYLEGCKEAELTGAAVVCAIVIGHVLVVANAGDCRAVLSIEGMSEMVTCDHKATNAKENERIESLGGSVDACGYLCRRLQLARALGDFDPAIKRIGDTENGLRISGPLSNSPDIHRYDLNDNHEFMILASDGLWDVLTSERAIELARFQLQLHNDVDKCAKELVLEAKRLGSPDNISCLVLCFKRRLVEDKTSRKGGPKRSVSREGLDKLFQAMQQ